MNRPILKNKIYLYLTEFFAGMSVMAAELGASRLLAPYFSSSQIVWTIIIGTIMIAMALGNLYGGRKADKDPNPDKLYSRILIAAIWLAAIPAVGKYVIIGVSAILIFSINSGFLIVAGFVSCMIVFVFPLFLLGTVTPSLVKYTMDSLDGSAGVVGRLNAFNTIGSIIGTFVPTFISIPAVGTSVTFLIFAGILLALSLVYFLSGTPKRKVKAGVAAGLFVICCIFGHGTSFAFWKTDLLYEGESVYNYLQVYEEDDEVVLSTNVLFGVQSVYKRTKGLTGMYYDYAMAAPYMAGIKQKDRVDALILGMGTGTFATQCLRFFDNISFEGVEIDEAITDLAGKYFELSKDIPVVTYDGRAYLNAIDRKYDIIMVDAYKDITIPFQMSSVEFFKLVADHLTEDGVMVVNMNMQGSKEGGINDYLADTISQAFTEVYTVDVPYSSNRELFASNSKSLLADFKAAVELESNPELSYAMAYVEAGLVKYAPGNLIMTDDKAPVELLGMKVIDELIGEEVAYYKGLIKGKSIREIIELFN